MTKGLAVLWAAGLMFAAADPIFGAPADPVGVAQKFVSLLAAKDYPGALALTDRPKGAGGERDMRMLGQMLFGATGSVRKAEIGRVVYSAGVGEHAVVIFTHTFTVDPKGVSAMKEKSARELADEFPRDEFDAAKRVIHWEGNTLVALRLFLLQKEKDSWRVLVKGDEFPFRRFRCGVRSKFGANLFHWGSEDMGDPGCHDLRDPQGRCFQCEDGPSANAAGGCFLGNGSPCPKGVDCLVPTDDGSRPCRKGESGCLTFEGDPCTVK